MMVLVSVLGMGALVALDQIFKILAVNFLKDGTILKVFGDVLVLKYTENTGSAFSLFRGHTEILTVLTLLILLAVPVVFHYMKFKHPWATAALILILPGGVGNLIDRVIRGYVVDYIYFTPINFPIFNFADILVVAGVICFAIFVLFYYRPGEGKKSNG